MNPMMTKPGQPLMMPPMMAPFVSNPVLTIPATNESTLYVGNLNSALEEMRLMAIFQPYGQVVSCRIMRDLYSHESRRFGFVSYANVHEAQRAREALNYKSIDGFEVRICFKRSPSDFKPESNIFVKNLPEGVSTKDLDELCSQYGKTISCSIRTDKNGKPMGYGYVQFDDENSAKKAIEALHDKEFKGSKLEVKNFVPSKNRALAKKNLYIKNFPLSWDQATVERQLAELFGKFGAITCSGVKEHKTMDGGRRFYAFAAYESEEAAAKAIEEYNGKFLDPENKSQDEEPLYVTYVQPKGVRNSLLQKEHLNYRNATNLFVRSLKEDVTDEDLLRVFGKYGKITSVVCKGTKPVFLGGNETMKFAYVNFAKEEDANEAYLKGKRDADIKALLHPLHKENFDFISYHQPKEIRAQYLRIKNNMKAALFPQAQFNMQRLGGGPYPYRKKKGPYHDNLGPMFMGNPGMLPPMQGLIPGMMPDMGMSMGMGMMGSGFPLPSPATGNNSTPSNSSRPGEKREEYNVEWLKKNKKEFLAMDKSKQSNLLGNLMYNRVLNSKMTEKDLVPKVTGMLIDLEILDYEEIIDILVNDESLKERIVEAVEVINEAPSS